MQQIIAALVLIAALVQPCLAPAKQEEVPRFDVARTCRDARAFTSSDQEVAFQRCMKGENEAREQLVQKWRHFKPADRKDCTGQGAAPAPSYVEILTCLEMNEEAAALNKPGRARAGKSQGYGLQRMPAAPSSSEPVPLPPPPAAGGATTGPN